MDKIRSLAPTFALWMVVLIGFGLVLLAYECWPTIVHYAAAMGEDPTPGARKKPTPEQIRRAQAEWRRRRAE